MFFGKARKHFLQKKRLWHTGFPPYAYAGMKTMPPGLLRLRSGRAGCVDGQAVWTGRDRTGDLKSKI